MNEADAWCYWLYVVSQLVAVPLPSEVSFNSTSTLLAVPVLHHALPLRAALASPCIFCLLWQGCACPACPGLCFQEPSQVVQKSLSLHYLNSCAPLSWYTFMHCLFVYLFVCLKIYCTAAGKVIWPLKALFSQAAFSLLLAFPNRRGFSQKGGRCSHVGSCVQPNVGERSQHLP